MTPEQFFQVLHDSQLARAFPWYFQSAWPTIVFFLSLLGFGFLVYVVVVRLWKRHNRNKENPDTLDIKKAFLDDAETYLDLAKLGAALFGLSAPGLALWIKLNPLKILGLIDPQIDSLYDLTPVGVQAVVDCLFWVSVLSLASAFCLLTVVWTERWRKVAETTPFESVFYPEVRSSRTNQIKAHHLWLLPIGCLLAAIVLLNISYHDHRTQSYSGMRTDLDQCAETEQPSIVWQNWSEVTSNPRQQLQIELAVRFSARQGLPPAEFTLQPEGVPVVSSVLSSSDPLSIVIFPMLSPELDLTQSKFIASVLRELLAQFELRGVAYRDRVQLYKPSPKDLRMGDPHLWPESAANELFQYAQDVARANLDLTTSIVKTLDNSPQRKVANWQADTRPLLILFHWYPGQESGDIYSPEVLNQWETLAAQKGQRFHFWIVDLVEDGRDDFVKRLNSSIVYLSVQVPSQLIDPQTMGLNLAPVLGSLKNNDLDGTIARLRPTRKLVIKTRNVYASRDSQEMRLLEGKNASCYYVLDLDEGLQGDPDPTLPRTRPVEKAANTPLLFVVLLGAIYPVALILFVVVHIGHGARPGTESTTPGSKTS